MEKHAYSKASIAPKKMTYMPARIEDRVKLMEAGLPVEFEAISIGTEDGQLCLVPLDESSEGVARVLVALWNNQIW